MEKKTGKKSENNSQHRQLLRRKIIHVVFGKISGNNKTDSSGTKFYTYL